MTLTIPHKFNPRDYQLPLLQALDNGTKRAVIVWHRRAGKDKTCFNYMVKRATERVGTYFYLLPSYKQAKKVIWDNIDNDGFKMLDHIPQELIRGTNGTELKIELVNGSVIQLIAADEFKDSGVGTNPVGVVFSEFSISKADSWDFIRPILAANGGWAIFNFTPRGKNHAWEILQKARENENWFTQVLTVDDTNVLSKEVLEEERLGTPESLFKQEYYCEFLEGAGQFFRRISQNTYDPNSIPLTEEGDFQLGVDLAKYQDWTVITPFNTNTFIAYPQDRFNQVDWNLQKARIEATARRYSNALIWPDATGVGDPIVEDLKARGLNVGGENEEGFKFTEISRMNLLNHLAILLEQDKIKIPNDPGLEGELESFRYELTERGKIKVTVPDGMTDDRVMSLALSVWGVTERQRVDVSMLHSVYQNRTANRSFRWLSIFVNLASSLLTQTTVFPVNMAYHGEFGPNCGLDISSMTLT